MGNRHRLGTIWNCGPRLIRGVLVAYCQGTRGDRYRGTMGGMLEDKTVRPEERGEPVRRLYRATA